MIAFEIAVRVPFAVAVNLDEPYAALDQPPCHQTFRADVFRLLLVESVKLPRLLRLVREIRQVAGLRLHPIRQFKALNAREQVRLAVMLLEMLAVNLFQKIKLRALIFARDLLRLREIENGRARRPKQRALITRRQKPRAPIERPALHALIVAEHHVARQVLALAAQPIGDPRARARKTRPRDARVDLVKRCLLY